MEEEATPWYQVKCKLSENVLPLKVKGQSHDAHGKCSFAWNVISYFFNWGRHLDTSCTALVHIYSTYIKIVAKI